MNEVEALDLLRMALWTVVEASWPCITAAMVVGIAIAMFQALTQIQEMTLTFIPKIVVILLTASATAPMIGGTVFKLAEHAYGRIAHGF